MNGESVSTEEIIGIYEVLGKTDKRAKDGHVLYRVRCMSCGTEREMRLHDVKTSKQCFHQHERYQWKTKRLRMIFYAMKRRCFNANDKNYHCYGGRGITVCEEWLLDPEKFERWSMSTGYKDGLTIDRIDSNGDYCPENCRWVTNVENARHKSSTKYLTVPVTLTQRQWSFFLHRSNHYVSNLILSHGKEYAIERLSKEVVDVVSGLV